MNKQTYILLACISLAFIVLFGAADIFFTSDGKTHLINENQGKFIWPTYKHDFSRTGNLQLKSYELKAGHSMGTVGSNAPESMKRDIFESGEFPSPVFADVDFDGDDEIITYYKNTIYDKETHARPFVDFIMLLDYKKNPTLLEKLEFGEVPFMRKWFFKVDDEVHTSFAVGNIDSDKALEVIFGSDSGYVYALEGDTGKLKWKFETQDKVRSSPVIGDTDSDSTPEIIFGSDDGNIYALDGTDSRLKWKFKTGDKIRGSPTLFMDEYPYITFGSDNKNLYVLNGQGKKSCSFKADDMIRSSPVIYKKNIVFSDIAGNIYFLSKKCELQNKYIIGSKVLGSGAIFDNHIIFAAEDGFLHFFDRDGQKNKINIFAPSFSTPLNVNDDLVLISTTDGKIRLINETGVYTTWDNNMSLNFSISPSAGVIENAMFYSGFYIQKEGGNEYAGVFVMSFIDKFQGIETS